MPKFDVRINKPDMQITFDDIKPGEAFWCTDGYLNIACKRSASCQPRQAVVIADGQIWVPDLKEHVRPASVAVIEV